MGFPQRGLRSEPQGAPYLFWTKQIGGWNVQIQGADYGL